MRSPYNHGLSPGLVNPNHTSSIQMVYYIGAYPTPWPWVLASDFLSIILGALSAYTSWKQQRKSGIPSRDTTTSKRRTLHTFAAVGVLISTIRSFSALILTCIAIHTGHGRRGSPSNMLMLLTSLGISIVNRALSPFLKYLTQLSFVLTLVTFLMTLWSPTTIRGNHLEAYGTLHVVGGNCPRKMSDSGSSQFCIERITNYDLREACRDWWAEDLSPDYLRNPLRVSEITLYVVGMIYGAFVLLGTLSTWRIFIIPFEIPKFFRTITESHDSYRELFQMGRPDWHDDNDKKKGVFYSQMFSLVVAFIVCSVSIPIHVTATTNSKAVQIYADGSPLGTAPNDTWQDCFALAPPTDTLGFWEFWWGEEKGRVAHMLAVI